MPESANTALITSPLGELRCGFAEAGALTELYFDAPDAPEALASAGVAHLRGGAAVAGPAGTLSAPVHDTLTALTAQLSEYFAGRRRSFELPLAPQGTVFQLAVWDELARIAYGATISYAELARRVDLRLGPTPAAAAGMVAAEQPGGSLRIRAVGRANALNPISIILPCHRVIGSRGELTGYAGGLWRKRALLMLERALPTQLFPD